MTATPWHDGLDLPASDEPAFTQALRLTITMGEREARQKHMIGLWYEAGTLHSALRSAWVRHGHFGSPQEARLFRLQWRAYQRQERRGDAYDKAF